MMDVTSEFFLQGEKEGRKTEGIARGIISAASLENEVGRPLSRSGKYPAPI